MCILPENGRCQDNRSVEEDKNASVSLLLAHADLHNIYANPDSYICLERREDNSKLKTPGGVIYTCWHQQMLFLN